PWLTVQFKEPLALYPLMAVGLITPFSVIVGAFRGAFQGVYKMEYILSTRAIEQVFMILVATALVILGLSATGAVLGSVTGFMASAALSIFIFKRYMWKYIPKPEIDYKFPIKEELNLAKKLIFFSIPVTVTALAEMGIYSICTYIIGIFLTSTFNGYFAAADPIARLPLVISISVATVILPASSEAFATKNKTLLERYVTLSYKYSLFFIIPMCIGIALFSHEIMALVYFLKPAYVLGAPSLAILVIGMSFYSLFAVSASIVQGIGNPRIPMYILIIGSGITFGLAWFFIQWWGIEGGALATTLATFIIMLPILWLTFKLTKTTVPYKPIGKIIAASAIMAIIIVLFIKIALGTFIGYQSRIGLVVGIIICPIIYLISLILLKFFTKEEINQISSYSNKLGPLSGVLNKILNIIGKYTK
ncbi:MAG: flippase, partial [Methanobrevibacter sp.]|nr:flippase [Methanobrevibacter sp.]